MSAWSLRKRVPSETIAVPANRATAAGSIAVQPANTSPGATQNTVTRTLSRIMAGVFGSPNPASYTASAQVAEPAKGAFYQFHEGDLFTPGAMLYAFQPTTELTPLNTTWGRAFLRTPNTFSVYQHPQLATEATVKINGIGGLVAGQLIHQPLESTGT